MRTVIKLMEDWRFALVPEGEALLAPDKMPDEDRFTDVFLPHDWAVDAPFSKTMDRGNTQGYRDRFGIGWYKKTLRVDAIEPGKVYELRFGGVFENSTCFVNGQNVGGRKYGYSPFALDITRALHPGENEIIVKADNTAHPADRWYSGCGIYRSVQLVILPEDHLDESAVRVVTKLENGAALVHIDAGRAVHARLCDRQGGCLEGDTDAAGKLALFVENPRLWSSDAPNLYDLTLSIPGDSITFAIGLREAKLVPGDGLYVNGQKVILHGVCAHQDIGCRGTAAVPELWRVRLQKLKDMGCNALRCAHHLYSAEFLDLCDEMGFYVYEEPFDKWTAGLYGRYYATQWEKDVEAMVLRDRNRPSILFWGCGNEVENQGQPSMLKILADIAGKIRSLDDTRPLGYAMNPHFKRESGIDASKVYDIQAFVDTVSETEITDPFERVERIARIGDIVDVICCNYQEQWYDIIHEAMPDKLILGTEVFQYFRGHYNEMQNYSEKVPSLAPEEFPFVIGSMIWTAYDYLGESGGWPSKGWQGAFIRTNGEERFLYHVLKSYWVQEPMVHISVLDMTQPDEANNEHWAAPAYHDNWNFPQYHKTMIPYAVASNCDEVAIYVNDLRMYVKKPAECENRIVTGYVPWRAGVLRAVGYRDGQPVCEHALVTPGPAVQLAFDDVCASVPAGAPYEMLVTVRALDDDGNCCYRESAPVRFTCEGPAQVLRVDNGDLMSFEPYRNDTIHMFHGCASVLVRFGGQPGRVALTAHGAGLREGRAIFVVE